MKAFTKTITKTYKSLWIRGAFSKYTKEFIKIRSTMKYKADRCFKCNKKFEIDEIIGLACFDKIGNKVLCQECVKELL